MARRPGKQPKRNKLPTTRARPKFDNALPAKAAEAWEKAGAADRKAAIEKARRYVSDHFTYRGEAKSPHQDSPWPRTKAFYDNGKPIEGTPDEFQRAVTMTATFYAAGMAINAQARPHIFAMLGPILEPEALSDEEAE